MTDHGNPRHTHAPHTHEVGPDRPTGVWDAALSHLAEAERLMGLLKLDTPTGAPVTLADVCAQLFRTSRAAIGGHYRHEWTKVAMTPVVLVERLPRTDPPTYALPFINPALPPVESVWPDTLLGPTHHTRPKEAT